MANRICIPDYEYMAVGGSLEYNMACTRHHIFSPKCRLYNDDTVLILCSIMMRGLAM